MTIRDIVLRAVKTALQTFLAVLVAAGTGYVNISTLKGAAIAAGAAALSAINNAITTQEAIE